MRSGRRHEASDSRGGTRGRHRPRRVPRALPTGEARPRMEGPAVGCRRRAASPGGGRRPGVVCGGSAHGGPMRRLARWATAATIVAIALYVVLYRLGSYDILEVGGASALPRSRLRAYEYVFHLG